MAVAGTESTIYTPHRAGRQHDSGVLYTYTQGQYRSMATQRLSLYTSKTLGMAGQIKGVGVQYTFQVGELQHPVPNNPSEHHIYSIWGYDQADLPQFYNGRLMLTDTHGIIVSLSKELSIYGTTGYLPTHNTPGTRFAGRLGRAGDRGSLTRLTNGRWVHITNFVFPSEDSFRGVIRSYVVGRRRLASSERTPLHYIVSHLHHSEMENLKGHLSGQGGNIDPTVPTTILPRRYPATYIPVRRRPGQ
ncbi:hypothetical protein [Paenibacillus sp. W2I17]|uniref:hypothetical protein n=1 Tax=Paenibacillus sp. W2I17 TaxID=3042311 RepID=UPI0027896846|nr:hypothetical protein [Paenibacillus sp. W2I17]MDQ0655359.1 hypothetical protein [Paenibacillus sp. W2I17]